MSPGQEKAAQNRVCQKMKTRLLIFVIGTIVLSSIIITNTLDVQYAYAGCVATILPQPCFDAFMGSHEPMTQKSIMEGFGRHIEARYPNWQMSERNWDNFDKKLNLPAIICTEFVSEGVTQYRMAKWVDALTISSFENHRNDWMCNIWLPPIDDGITVMWDKSRYLPDGTGRVQVIDKDMNLDAKKLDSFKMHVHSDTDHTGIQLLVTETIEDSGIFEGTVFFTTAHESGGNRLLVEDAVHARYKENYTFSRIINESEPEVENEQSFDPSASDFRESGDDTSLLYAYSGLSLVGVVVGFFAVKKWRNRK